jgi:hypothetical protein
MVPRPGRRGARLRGPVLAATFASVTAGKKTMALALQCDEAVPRPAMREDDRLAPAVGVFNSVCICSMFWLLVGLAAYLLS